MSSRNVSADAVVAGYTLEGVLGRGATAVVYRATKPDRTEAVALKLITPDSRLGDDGEERFEREARLAAAVVHRGILPVYEVGQHGGHWFVAMRLAPRDLAALLRSEGRLEPQRAVSLVAQLASALDAAHAHGLVHRDVKPSNVLLEEAESEERAYLADFGVARAAFTDGGLLSGEFVGTVGYASPEQIRGEPVDLRTDVYALGCLLHECLTGRIPYASKDALATLWGHLHHDPPLASVLVPDLPHGLDEVVARALAKSPEERFASAGELASSAQSALEGRPSPRRAAADFLGREEELRAADLLLKQTRLVTIAGPGGAGKTRFALELATRAEADYSDGVFSCFLSPLRDPDLVVPTIAQALSISEQPGKSAVEAVSSEVGARRILLVLDNLEHLLPAAPALDALLEACPSLALLVTSQERLNIASEAAFDLPPLSPGDSEALFCNRAACRPSDTIAELCSRLEGLPLAIELAAAGTSVFSPQQLLERLSSRLDVLRSEDRDDPRHETLRATISWSFDLLSPAEQLLLTRLSVFRSGCTIESAKQVAHAELDRLQSLVDKNLLRHTEGRYWMLETIREYAAERLALAGEANELRLSHAEHFLELSVQAEPELRGGERSGEWVERLESEQDNLRAVLDRRETTGDRELGLQLAGNLSQFWYLAGHAAEGAQQLARALGVSDEPTPARAKALRAAAVLALTSGDLPTGKAYAEQAASVCRQLDDRWGLAHVGFILGHATADEELFSEAERHFKDSAQLFRELGDAHYALLCIYNLAEVIAVRGDDRARARALLEQSVAEGRLLSDQRIVGLSLIQLGAISAEEGRLDDALSLFAESLELTHGIGVRVEIPDILSRFAAVLARTGEMEGTVRVLAGSEALREEIGSASLPLAAKRNEETLRAVRADLDEAAFSEAWERGRTLSVYEAISSALELTPARSDPAPGM